MLVIVLGVMFTAAALWMTPFWSPRQSPAAFISRETFGFLVPGLVLMAHFYLWRTRGAEQQTRLTLASGALLIAAFVTLEVTRADGDAEWLGAVVGALSFAAAIGVNFLPGVVRQRQPTSR
jgi:peptidoglycan/LPS O-acetylase OafA/YrhL